MTEIPNAGTPGKYSHALTDFVLELFSEAQPAHDRLSVSLALTQGPARRNLRAAYNIVADHALRSMASDGLLRRDEVGLYRLARRSAVAP
jgi:hypothetical protein